VRFATALLLLAALLLPACGERKPPGTLISNALVYDGSGGAPRVTSVRIVGERIDTVGDLRPEPDEWYIEGLGFALAPGYIDLRPGDGEAGDRGAVGSVSRGVTTMVIGVDGRAPSPIGSLLSGLDSTPIALNTAAFAGLQSLRARVGIPDGRAPTLLERDSLRALLFAELDGGALGLAARLDTAAPSELLYLAGSTGAEGGRLLLQVDGDNAALWRQVGEGVRVAQDAGIPLYIHVAGPARPGLADTLTRLLDSARTAGAQVITAMQVAGPREERIRQRTSLPARALGLRDRGVVRVRAWADLVLFDTTATSDSVGIRMVWINGEVVWEHGQGGTRYPGRVVRK
jgi:N-acyl-D-amino-acid deacylase